MDRNDDALALLVATKLDDTRAAAARGGLVPRRRPRARAWLGMIPILIGRRLVAGDVSARVEPTHG
jgi:hypothetical protein